MKKLIGICAVVALMLIAAPALALNEPSVNLGFTNFIDGASPGPGWYLQEYLQYYEADDVNDSDGDTLLDDVDLEAWVNLNQIVYQSDINFLGGNPGIDVIIPVVALDVDDPLSANDGIGDVLIGPFIQWGPNQLFGRPYFHRFEFQVLTPTGDYDDDVALNPGSNVWSINPYYTFTYFLTPKLELSVRTHYLWSDENDDHPSGLDTQAGQAIHLNYGISYQVIDPLRVGVAGYYLKQLEEDEVDGHSVDDTEEEVFAVGPGLVWHINKDLTLMGAVNFETEAENRPEGIRSTLRLVWKFW